MMCTFGWWSWVVDRRRGEGERYLAGVYHVISLARIIKPLKKFATVVTILLPRDTSAVLLSMYPLLQPRTGFQL
jgi:hypothetical protein